MHDAGAWRSDGLVHNTVLTRAQRTGRSDLTGANEAPVVRFALSVSSPGSGGTNAVRHDR
jgi:hypothetical protein